MKNKKICLYIIIGILSIGMIGLMIYSFLINKEEEIKIDYEKGNFYLLNTIEMEPIESRILTNEEELLELFPEENTNIFDFTKYNYALIEIELYNCGDRNLDPVGYLFENNTITAHFTYEASCGLCAPEYIYYLLELSKEINDANIKTTFKARNDPQCDPYVAYKPIIYIYPEKEQEIEIKLSNPEKLLFTYPKYNQSWKVIAKPNGTLIQNNKEYYALFWEGADKKNNIKEEGFVVEGKETEQFLEEKLEILGLNPKERNEFIIFWLPKLEQNPYNYIYFETEEEINQYMSLEINPKPNNLIRIHMEVKPLQEKIKVKEQVLNTPEREGYTIVEWGGSFIQ